MSGNDSAPTPAVNVLKAAAVRFRAHSYVLDTKADTYGEAVAAALGVEPERLFKTLLAEVDGTPVVGIVPVSSRLSLKGLARAAGGRKAAMISPGEAERLTGYVTGGISPFGQKRRLPTYVDESVVLFDAVFVSGGRRGLQIELAPDDLIKLTGATTAGLTE